MATAITDVELLYSPGCPHLDLARSRLGQAVELVGAADVRIHLRRVPDASGRWVSGWGGSPTILVGGVDLFEIGTSPVGAACRLYSTAVGAEGAPSVESLVEALSRTQEAEV